MRDSDEMTRRGEIIGLSLASYSFKCKREAERVAQLLVSRPL